MHVSKKYFALLCFCTTALLHCYGQGPAEGFFNIKNYGATGDGHTLDTKGFDNAIAACVKAGGGTVFVPPGKFVTGTIRLYSNMELRLSPGAVILASENPKDYLLQGDFGFSGSGAGGKTLGIIFANEAENVSITGAGIIDGNASSFMYLDSTQVSSYEDRKYSRQGKDYMGPAKHDKEAPVMWKGEWINRPGTQIVFHACKKVLVRDIIIRNANDWTFDLNACDNVKVLGITIDNDERVPNSDGIDMYDSRNVIIADCDVRAGDDGMAVISSSNVTVTNCSFNSRSCGIRIGYNAFNDADSGNLLFDNVRIYGSNRGIGIFQRRKGNISNMVFSNLIIDTRLYPGQWWGHGEPIHISALPGLGSKEVGTISNIRFTNIIAKGEEGIVLYGSYESALKDISFENIQLTLVKGAFTAVNGGNFDLRATNDSKLAIFKHDIPALFATHINGLTIKDMDVRWGDGLPNWFTNAIWCDNFQNLLISRFTGSAGPNSAAGEAVIALHNGNGAVLSGVKLNERNKGVGHRLISYDHVTGVDVDGTKKAGTGK